MAVCRSVTSSSWMRRAVWTPRPPSLGLPAVTSLRALPLDADELRLTGGCFVTIANHEAPVYDYFERNVVVSRSNVVIDGLRHEVTREGDHGAPYNGFLRIDGCARVEVRNCQFTGRQSYQSLGSTGNVVTMGPYDLIVEDALGVPLRNCLQTNDIDDESRWGIFGFNHCKNIVFDGCVLSRFDAHRGVYNVTIRNSMLGHMCIRAIGQATLLVENIVATGDHLINLRRDYGSSWRGEVIVRDCRFLPRAGAERRSVLAFAQHASDHDFGYPCVMPCPFVFESIRIDDTHHQMDDPGLVAFSDTTTAAAEGVEGRCPYAATEEVVLIIVTTATGVRSRSATTSSCSRSPSSSPHEQLLGRTTRRDLKDTQLRLDGDCCLLLYLPISLR